jgi:hypothetical protein
MLRKSKKIDPHTLSAVLVGGEDCHDTSGREIIEAEPGLPNESTGSVIRDLKVENLSYGSRWRRDLKITVPDPFDDKSPSTSPMRPQK